MPIEYYRSNDPLENLRLELFVREISRPKDYNSTEANDLTPFVSILKSISWQQKYFSPSEIVDYLLNKSNNRKGTSIQIETRSVLSRLEASGIEVEKMLCPVMLYTYIDRDHYSDNFPVTDGKERTYTPFATREMSYKTMHICVATDVQIDEMLKDKYEEYRNYYHEHVLCSLRVYLDGLIEVSPALSKVVGEPSTELPYDLSLEYSNTLNPTSTTAVQSLSLFLNELTTEFGLKKGFRLSTFRFRSQSGSDFEFVIYNTRDILIPHRIEEIIRKEEVLDSIRAVEIRGLNQNDNWKQDPSKADRVICYQLELVSAERFDVSKLFLAYQLYIPPGWMLRTGDITDGEINFTNASNDYNDLDAFGMLQGSTHTATVTDVRTFKSSSSRFGLISSSISRGLSQTSRLILGITFFVISVVSVLVGVQNALWILPALVVYFAYRNGSLQTTLVNELSSSSSSDLLPLKATLNHMINYNFDATAYKVEENRMFNPTTQYPILFIQVFSKGLLNRITLEGYSEYILPVHASEFDVELHSWKPVGSVKDQLYEFFIGDSIKIRDAGFTRDFDLKTKTLNRFGVLTRSFGNVRLRGKVIVSDGKVAEIKQQKLQDLKAVSAKGPGANSKVKKTVAEIMKSFKESKALHGIKASAINPERRQLNSESGTLTKTGDRPSIRSILDKINANAKTSASDILNRVRTKNHDISNQNHPELSTILELTPEKILEEKKSSPRSKDDHKSNRNTPRKTNIEELKIKTTNRRYDESNADRDESGFDENSPLL